MILGNQKTFRVALGLASTAILFSSCGGGNDPASLNSFIANSTPTPTPTSLAAPSVPACVGESWQTIATSPLAARDEAGIFWTGTDFLIYGGVYWGVSKFNDGARYNPTTDTWTMISSVGAPSADRWDASYAYGNNELFVFGGNGAGGGNTGGLYHIKTDSQAESWTASSTTNAPTPRAYHVSYFHNSKFYIFGGNDTTNSLMPIVGGGGKIYDPAANSWTSIASGPTVGSYFASASNDSNLFVFGGTSSQIPWAGNTTQNGLSTVSNSGAIYDYAHDTWKIISTVNAPTARRSARAIAVGSKFVVWGGWSDNEDNTFNTGGIYDPSTDTWTSMSTAGAPPGGPATAMIYTGKRVVVWGIDNNPLSSINQGVNIGGIFNADTNNWETLTTALNAPAYHGYQGQSYSLWNGSEMLIWSGGYPAVNAGSIYTPPCGAK